MPTAQQQQILDKCTEVKALALQHLGIDLSHVPVFFDVKARCAGIARRRGGLSVHFNRDMLTRDAFDHILNSTVSHEFAHIVCFINPRLGANHNPGWARVCKLLGGTSKRCHSEEVVYGNGCTYEYTTDKGLTVRTSQQRHKKIQGGTVYTFGNKGRVNKHCAHSIVGYQGRTLTESERSMQTAKGSFLIGAPEVNPGPADTVQGLNVRKPAPVARAASAEQGTSKAAISRAIMLAGTRAGHSYELIIAAMMERNGYSRQLARATYLANAARVGITV